MAEIVTAETWLYSKLNEATLKGYATGGIFTWPAPTEYSQPYVLFQMQSGRDIRGNGPTIIGVNGLWLVRAIFEQASWGGNLKAAADRINTLLHAASGTATGGTIWACVRTEPFQLVEVVAGRQFRHLGGIYRLWVT